MQRVAVGVVGEVQAALRVLEGEAPALPALLHRAATQLRALALVARRRHVGVAAGRVSVLDGGVHVGLEPALTWGGKDTVRTRSGHGGGRERHGDDANLGRKRHGDDVNLGRERERDDDDVDMGRERETR